MSSIISSSIDRSRRVHYHFFLALSEYAKYYYLFPWHIIGLELLLERVAYIQNILLLYFSPLSLCQFLVIPNLSFIEPLSSVHLLAVN